MIMKIYTINSIYLENHTILWKLTILVNLLIIYINKWLIPYTVR